MPDHKAAGRDWEKFWNTIWFNLFHVLGVAAVLAFVAAIAWSIFAPSATPERLATSICRPNSFENAAKQVVTSVNLLKEGTPCVGKGKTGSDLSSCTVFGLKPGMSNAQVAATIDQSGYFHCETVLSKVAGADSKANIPAATASHYKDGFHLSVEFVPDSAGDASAIKASGITVVLGPGANPYFDPMSMRPTMRKLFGPPDDTNETSDEWRSQSHYLRAYAYDQSYWIVFRQTQ